MIRKIIAEIVGTMLLVIFGCGTAVAANQYVTGIYGIALPFTMLLISVAFGLILVALAYSIGKVSGAHVNPAVSIAMLIDGRMSIVECVEYVVAQILGGFAGATVLGFIFGGYSSLGANGYGTLSALPDVTTMQVALIVEAILTFVFVLVVLSVTKNESCNSGIVIGLTLCLVHVLGIPFTGTSVNPARSIAPAVLTGGESLNQLWVFIVGPLVGAILAALFFKFILSPKEEVSELEEDFEEDFDEEDEEIEEVEEIENEEDEEDEEAEEEPVKETKKTKKTKKGNK